MGASLLAVAKSIYYIIPINPSFLAFVLLDELNVLKSEGKINQLSRKPVNKKTFSMIIQAFDKK